MAPGIAMMERDTMSEGNVKFSVVEFLLGVVIGGEISMFLWASVFETKGDVLHEIVRCISDSGTKAFCVDKYLFGENP
jgi:hypothetical protein